MDESAVDCPEEETRKNENVEEEEEEEEYENKLAMEGAETDQEVNRYFIQYIKVINTFA
jgi:hypothetical protein